MNLHERAAVVLSATLLIYSVTAAAETQGLYFGLTGGQSNVDFSGSEFNAEVLTFFQAQDIDAVISDSSTDDTDASFGLYVGYGFNPYVGIEIGYIDLGEAVETANLNTEIGTVTASSRFSSSGGTLAIVGSYPFAGRFDVHGRGGLYVSDTRIQVRFRDVDGELLASGDDKASDTDLFAGVGIGWNINDTYTLRIDYQRFLDVGKTFEEDVNLLSVSILFR